MAKEYSAELAILGGPKAIQLDRLDRWTFFGREEMTSVVSLLTKTAFLDSSFELIQAFESEFAEFSGAKYCIAHNNGTAALYAAYFTIGIGPGDQVITPSYTWIASFAPAWHLGAEIVFCDIEKDTLLIDPKSVAEHITPRTRVIVVPHLWGHVAKMDALTAISRDTGVSIIEDCSHAPGATWNGHPVGSFGDIGCFSLQGTKPISAGEGGVLITNSRGYFEKAALVGQLNRTGQLLPGSIFAELGVVGLGLKFRPHPLGIALARAQLKRFPELNEKRTESVNTLRGLLTDIGALKPVQVRSEVKRGGFYSEPWIYHQELAHGVPLANMIGALQAEGVPVRSDPYQLWHQHAVFTGGMRPQEVFHSLSSVDGKERGLVEPLPITEDIFPRIMHLPVLTDPAPGALEQIAEGFHKVFRNCELLLN